MGDGTANRWNSPSGGPDVEYAAIDERRLASVLAMPGPANQPFSVRAGRRVNGKGLEVSVSGSPVTVTVTAGGGVIYDSTYATGSAWTFVIPSNVTKTLAARPGSGQSRIDLVIARIYDQDSSVGSSRQVVIEVVTGTAGASPSAPSLPALSLLLATLEVPASGSVTVTPSVSRAVAAGGVIPVATTAERDALVSSTAAYVGMCVFNAQTGHIETYTGSSWSAASVDTDTGWSNLSLSSGYQEQGTGNTPQVRRRNGRVSLQGLITRTTGSFPASTSTPIATITDAANRPARNLRLPAGASPVGDVNITVTTAGVISIVTASTVPAYVSLDGISYEV